jgi:hypothetical protein
MVGDTAAHAQVIHELVIARARRARIVLRATYGRIAAVSTRPRVAFIPASMTAQSFSDVR